MVSNEVRRHSVERLLRQFEEALANLEAKHAGKPRTRLAQLEIDAVRSQAADLRAELQRATKHISAR